MRPPLPTASRSTCCCTSAADPAVAVNLDRYGLGILRDSAQYEQFCGVDFAHQRLADHACGVVPISLVQGDRGSQYCGDDFTRALNAYGIRASVSCKGDRCETWWPRTSSRPGRSRASTHVQHVARPRAQSDIVGRIEGLRNRFRRHSSIGCQMPVGEELGLMAATFGVRGIEATSNRSLFCCR